jgi:hypothetical protein
MTMARERDHAHMQRTAPLLLFSLSQLSHHIMEPLPLAQLVSFGISASASVWDGSWGTCSLAHLKRGQSANGRQP